MSTYCVSDIHGEYEKYLALLDKIHFSENDTLYVIGDMIDRGPQPLAVVRDIMRRPNMIALAGNHDVMAALLLPHLLYGGRAEELDDKTIADIFLWMRDGAESTLKDFRSLSVTERSDLIEWLRELDVYCEINIGGTNYVLVHAGLGPNAGAERDLDDYDIEEYLFRRADYSRVIYPDKTIISGHTPTALIPGNPHPGRIYRVNNHIAIDCGCTFGGHLGAICLETGEEFYV